MELKTKNGVKFSGTVTELFALETGALTVAYCNGLKYPCRPVKVETIYGDSFILPSMYSALRFYQKISHGTGRITSVTSFARSLKDNTDAKTYIPFGKRRDGVIRYAQYTFRLA